MTLLDTGFVEQRERAATGAYDLDCHPPAAEAGVDDGDTRQRRVPATIGGHGDMMTAQINPTG